MRKTGFAVVALAAAVIVALLAVGIQAGADARPQRYIVVYSPNATTELKAAVAAAGGQVLRANNKIGVATVSSAKPSFRTRIAAGPNLVVGISNRLLRRARAKRDSRRVRF